jgi:hypothetical protein
VTAQLSPAARPAGARTLAKRFFERSDSVLWTDALPGIVLHNLETQRYLELGEVGYRAWALLDGARPMGDVVARLDAAPDDGTRGTRAAKVWEIVILLVEHRFIVERRDG